jgi:cell shape-determining protein MreD
VNGALLALSMTQQQGFAPHWVSLLLLAWCMLRTNALAIK